MMSAMTEGRRTPREEGGRAKRNDEPRSVPVDVESQERQLAEAGWDPVDRMGKRVWRHPETGHLYPHAPAIGRLRIDRGEVGF
jgi:hypothetical protein